MMRPRPVHRSVHRYKEKMQKKSTAVDFLKRSDGTFSLPSPRLQLVLVSNPAQTQAYLESNPEPANVMAQLQSVDSDDCLDLGPSFEQLHQLVSGNSTIETFDKYTRDNRGPTSLFMLNKRQGRYWEVTVLDLKTYDHQGPLAMYASWSSAPSAPAVGAPSSGRLGATGSTDLSHGNDTSSSMMHGGNFQGGAAKTMNTMKNGTSASASDSTDTQVVDHRTKAQLLRWLRRRLRDRLLGGFVLASPPSRKRKVSVDGSLDLPGIARLSPQAVLEEVAKRGLAVVPVLADGCTSRAANGSSMEGDSAVLPRSMSDDSQGSGGTTGLSVQGGGVTDDAHLDRVIALCLHVSGLDGNGRGQRGNLFGSLGSLVSPLDFLAYGGTRLGQSLFPFGPARLLDAQDVQRFHLAVVGVSDEQLRTAELQTRLNHLGLSMPSPPTQSMFLASPTKSLKARPGASATSSLDPSKKPTSNDGSQPWDVGLAIEQQQQQVAAAASVDYLIGKFNQLRSFLTRAVQRHNGVLLYHI